MRETLGSSVSATIMFSWLTGHVKINYRLPLVSVSRSADHIVLVEACPTAPSHLHRFSAHLLCLWSLYDYIYLRRHMRRLFPVQEINIQSRHKCPWFDSWLACEKTLRTEHINSHNILQVSYTSQRFKMYGDRHWPIQLKYNIRKPVLFDTSVNFCQIHNPKQDGCEYTTNQW